MGPRALSYDSDMWNPRGSHKRKRDDADDDVSRKPKSSNLTFAERFLIACLSLIWLKTDKRDRDVHGRVIATARGRSRKAYAPKSDLNQAQIIELYFTGLDRTVMSQSKTAPHAFAPPDWRLMESYLFPWISFNRQASITITRPQIKHIAFRLFEYWTHKGQVVMYHEPHTGLANQHFSDVPGWWELTDDGLPNRFPEWDGSIPGTHLK
jgi:hypothetical protein